MRLCRSTCETSCARVEADCRGPRAAACGSRSFVEVDAPDALLEALEEALRPQTARRASARRGVVPGRRARRSTPDADAVIALARSGRRRSRPSLDGARDSSSRSSCSRCGERADASRGALGTPARSTRSPATTPTTLVATSSALARRPARRQAPRARARTSTFMRRAVAEEAVKATALQNARHRRRRDHPRRRHAAHDREPGEDGPADRRGVRAAARRRAHQGARGGRRRRLRAARGRAAVLDLVPGFGWAIKAGIGYTGTLAMGYAAIEYFEGGGEIGASRPAS